jgi:hypothetical protein
MTRELTELCDEITALPEYPNTWEDIKTSQSIVDDENAKIEAFFNEMMETPGEGQEFEV